MMKHKRGYIYTPDNTASKNPVKTGGYRTFHGKEN